VPRFEPFVALRYGRDAGELHELTAPPYDVLSDAEVEALAASHPHNIVHVDVPRPAAGPDRYERAAALLEAWVRHGVLVPDDAPSFTLYRMEFTDAAGRHRQTVGVIGALEVVDEGAGGVLPHERTTPKAASDRLDLTRATRTNLSPVWGLSLATGLSAALADPGEPLGAVAVDGVTHTVERVTDPARLAEIAALVGSRPVLIADGHHRYAVSRTYRDEVRAATGRLDTAAELTMTYVGELVENQLSVEAIHRLYRGISADGLEVALSRCFDLEPAGQVTPEITAAMVERGALVLVHPDGRGTWLRPRADAFRGVRDLDGARLEAALDGVEHEVTYQHGVAEVVALVAGGHATAGVLIRPVSVAEIRRTADEGVLMPPKSTFFTPKLRTGLVLRPLDGPG
jgi:uncharacterized protein (DUF1015 family)